MCIKRDINSGHSSRKWKWSKMIFGFLERNRKIKEKCKTTKTQQWVNYFRTDILSWVERHFWQRDLLTHLVTKHFKTSSCLQTNSIKRGDVILEDETETEWLSSAYNVNVEQFWHSSCDPFIYEMLWLAGPDPRTKLSTPICLQEEPLYIRHHVTTPVGCPPFTEQGLKSGCSSFSASFNIKP